ncbi:MAG: dienelactone hydrolase family protein [Anaerolineales bacterium]
MVKQNDTSSDPHHGQPIRAFGEPLQNAQAAMLMVHGRGARSEDILTLANQFGQRGFAFLAPQAANNTWYPNRFLAPLSDNEPWLSSALRYLDGVLAQILDSHIPAEHIILFGFSQGACLTLEFAARHAQRFGCLVGLSGALIGPDVTPRQYPGSLAGTPVFLGCSDTDPHVPKEYVNQTAEVLRGLGGQVTERLYPNLGHSVNQDEMDFVRGVMQRVLADS